MMLKHDDVLSFHSMTDKDVMSVYELERECFSVPWSNKIKFPKNSKMQMRDFFWLK